MPPVGFLTATAQRPWLNSSTGSGGGGARQHGVAGQRIQLFCRARANDNYILPIPLESALKEWTPRVGVNLVTRLD